MGKLFGVAQPLINRFFPNRNKPRGLRFEFPFLDNGLTEFTYQLQLQPVSLEWVSGVFIDNSQNTQQFQLMIGETGQRVTVPAYSQACFELFGLDTDKVTLVGVSIGNINITVTLLNFVPDSANSIWAVIDPGSVVGAITVNGVVTALPSVGVLGDASGTIAVGGTPQLVFNQNLTRRILHIYNLNSNNEILGVSLGGPVNLGSPGLLEVFPGGMLMYDGSFIPNQSVYVVAATTGSKFTAKQF